MNTEAKIVWSLGPVYTERQHQRSDKASDAALIDNNEVALKWVATPKEWGLKFTTLDNPSLSAMSSFSLSMNKPSAQFK